MARRKRVTPGTLCAVSGCPDLADRHCPDRTTDDQPVGVDDLGAPLAGVPMCAKHAASVRRHGRLRLSGPDRRAGMKPVLKDELDPTPAPTPTPDPTPAPEAKEETPMTPTPDLPKIPLPRATPGQGQLSTPEQRIAAALADRDRQIADLRQRIDQIDLTPIGGGKIDVKIVRPDGIDRQELDGPVHSMFKTALLYLANGEHLWLYGPRGTGKTEMARQLASALGRPFHATGRISHETSLSGYFQPHNGQILRTPYRDSYEGGGVFLLDDADRSDATALSWLDMALSNNVCPFPDKIVDRNDDHACVLTANTIGQGAADGYAGAMIQDEALVDRFAFLFVDYDKDLERSLMTSRFGQEGIDWAETCWAYRAAASKVGLDVAVSMRVLFKGALMLKAGAKAKQVEESYLRRGMDDATWRKWTNEAKKEG